MNHRVNFAVAVIVLAAAGIVAAMNYKEILWYLSKAPFIRDMHARPTVLMAIAEYGETARNRLKIAFAKHDVAYPPEKVAILAIKSSRQVAIYAANKGGSYVLICSYPIKGISGQLGPKLREGDGQVPEGIYSLSLEPNTPYHLALRLNYPNTSDLARARSDGRTNPGSAILMHGGSGSSGCIAMGDPVSEDLFVLVHDTGPANVQLIVSPTDLRTQGLPAGRSTDPIWLPVLYSEIKTALSGLPK